MRTARTDAGVSALGNVFSLKMILSPLSLTDPQNTTSSTDEGESQPQQASKSWDARPLINHLNSFLPPEIRIWTITRVQGSFHARTCCDSRKYEYSLPSYCFLPPKPGTAMEKNLSRAAGGVDDAEVVNAAQGSDSVPPTTTSSEDVASKEADDQKAPEEGEDQKADTSILDLLDPSIDLSSLPAGKFWNTIGTSYSYKQDLALKRKWRMDGDTLRRIRECVEKYEGSHNFHNFTVGKDFKDRSSQRVMKKMEVGSCRQRSQTSFFGSVLTILVANLHSSLQVTEPFLVNDCEWISFKFLGQSFMLHQIVRTNLWSVWTFRGTL